MEPIITKAMKFAAEKHENKRKYSGEPYVIHLQAVCQILRQVTEDRDVWVAGILHDVLEDTKTSYEDVEKEFGPRIAGLVKECTKENDKLNDLKSREGYLIKFADVLHNLGNSNDQKYIDKTLSMWKPRIIPKELRYHRPEIFEEPKKQS